MAINSNYQSYLLRFWRAGADEPWRASLQCTATGEKIAFADLAALLAFLGKQMTVDEETRTVQANTSSPQDSCSSSYKTGEAL